MITVHKAQPHREEVVPDLDLRAVASFPDDLDREQGLASHEYDAQRVVSALLASLPGGTVDAVLRLLLNHRASLLRVRTRVGISPDAVAALDALRDHRDAKHGAWT